MTIPSSPSAVDREDPFAWMPTAGAEPQEATSSIDVVSESAPAKRESGARVESVRSVDSTILTGAIVEEVQAAGAQTPAPRGPGRPVTERPHRVIGYVRTDLANWIRKLEHTERVDGTYFASQAELVNRLMEIAKEAIDDGRAIP